MKNNRKNRKLNFIREKNRLRLQVNKIAVINKLTKEEFDHKILFLQHKNKSFTELLNTLINNLDKFNLKRYELYSEFYFSTGYINDDFVNNLLTSITDVKVRYFKN